MNRYAGKVGRLAPLSPAEHLPDPNRSRLPDIRARNLFLSGQLGTSHSTLSVGNEQIEYATQPMRIRGAQVENVTGGTVTVQVTVDGRDLFDDAQRPVSDAGFEEATDLYVIPTGAVVKTVIEATSGVPAGTAAVLIDTEPYTLIPRQPRIELTGKDRLFPSRRRYADLANAGMIAAEGSAGRQVALGTGSAVAARTVLARLGGAGDAIEPPAGTRPPPLELPPPGGTIPAPPTLPKPPPVP